MNCFRVPLKGLFNQEKNASQTDQGKIGDYLAQGIRWSPWFIISWYIGFSINLTSIRLLK